MRNLRLIIGLSEAFRALGAFSQPAKRAGESGASSVFPLARDSCRGVAMEYMSMRFRSCCVTNHGARAAQFGSPGDCSEPGVSHGMRSLVASRGRSCSSTVGLPTSPE